MRTLRALWREVRDRLPRIVAGADYLGLGHLHGRGHVDEVAADLAGLGVSVPSHRASEEAVEATGDRQQGHVEVHLEAHRGGQGVQVEEAHGVGQRVLDEHALGVARDHRGGSPAVVREEDCRVLVAQVLNDHPAEGMRRGGFVN
jgi:hypothetical protein